MKINSMPTWAKDMVVYELATKGFTSPNGAESGTFRSACERFGYLKELGVNTLWITGHQLCNPTHFYNIWTQYAVIDPSQLDPTLGTPQDFAYMVQQAHENGLRVILDVITHGVMSDSTLVQEHPDWFCPGTWGMTDFDWFGNHPDLDDWWVNIWTGLVRDYGVDGYRLDVAHYRPDLWCKIRAAAAQQGHEIVLIPESGPAIEGVFDTLQHGDRLSDQRRGVLEGHHAFADVARYVHSMAQPEQDYRVEIFFTDETSTKNHTGSYEGLRTRFVEFCTEQVPVEDETGYVQQLCVMQADNLPIGKQIENVIIRDSLNNEWALKPGLTVDYFVRVEGTAPSVRLTFPVRQPANTLLSQQFTCHDNGWIGYPAAHNPYLSQYSRFAMGYAFLLAPLVPVMMGGEEFSADYVPLPQLSPDLYGGAHPGSGRWLYGSWLQWQQLQQPEKAAMQNDVRTMLALRREYSDVICAVAAGSDVAYLEPAQAQADAPIPVPYLYRMGREAILVAGNPYADKAVHFSCSALDGWRCTQVLFGKKQGENMEIRKLCIEKDKTPQGGLLVLKLERNEENKHDKL